MLAGIGNQSPQGETQGEMRRQYAMYLAEERERLIQAPFERKRREDVYFAALARGVEVSGEKRKTQPLFSPAPKKAAVVTKKSETENLLADSDASNVSPNNSAVFNLDSEVTASSSISGNSDGFAVSGVSVASSSSGLADPDKKAASVKKSPAQKALRT